jgi:DNA repair protein RadA/Sms
MLPEGFVAPKTTLLRKGVVRSGDVNSKPIGRQPCGIFPIDRVFGGIDRPGMPRGFSFQFAGEPGLGKSTLLTQMVGGTLAKKSLYISSEESAERISSRAKRLNVKNPNDFLILVPENVEEAYKAIEECDPDFVVVDSLQQQRSANGKHTQLVEAEIAKQYTAIAVARNLTVIMVSHMNKDAKMAGLKNIEHMVDGVARFEGDPNEPMRTLRCSKNREADTSYIAHFFMTDEGLKPYDPAEKKKRSKAAGRHA